VVAGVASKGIAGFQTISALLLFQSGFLQQHLEARFVLERVEHWVKPERVNKMYVDDNASKVPLFANKPWANHDDPDWEAFILGLGGNDADTQHGFMAPAGRRPLYPYLKPSAAFRCPADRGQEEQAFFQGTPVNGKRKPSNYETLGCSYCYNSASWGNALVESTDPYGLSYKRENWVSKPSHMIAMYEPPAMWYFNYYHWHYARGPTTDPNGNGPLFSPVLIVDGHSASFDFAHGLLSNPNSTFPLEPTKDWYWYEPAK